MSDASVDKVKGFKLLLTLILLFSSATSAYSRAEDKYDILYFAEGSTMIGKSTIGAYAEWCLHYNQGGFSYYYAGPYISIPITGWLAAQSAIYYIQDSGRPYAIWPSAGIKVSAAPGQFGLFLSESLVYDYSFIKDSAPFLRTRAGIFYKQKQGLLTPSIWCELYSWNDWIRIKTFAGISVRMSSSLSLTVAYLHSEINGRDYRLNHLVLGLAAKF